MKIVKFKDGTYGIRRWSLLSLEYEYKDLQHFAWWPLSSCWQKDCRGTLEEAIQIIDRLADKGKPI